MTRRGGPPSGGLEPRLACHEPRPGKRWSPGAMRCNWTSELVCPTLYIVRMGAPPLPTRLGSSNRQSGAIKPQLLWISCMSAACSTARRSPGSGSSASMTPAAELQPAPARLQQPSKAPLAAPPARCGICGNGAVAHRSEPAPGVLFCSVLHHPEEAAALPQLSDPHRAVPAEQPGAAGVAGRGGAGRCSGRGRKEADGGLQRWKQDLEQRSPEAGSPCCSYRQQSLPHPAGRVAGAACADHGAGAGRAGRMQRAAAADRQRLV